MEILPDDPRLGLAQLAVLELSLELGELVGLEGGEGGRGDVDGQG